MRGLACLGWRAQAGACALGLDEARARIRQRNSTEILIPCHNSPIESTKLKAAWTELHSPLSKGFAAGKPREGQSTLLLASAEIPISSLVVHYVPADCGPQSAISGCRSVLSR